jgi:hypothetical protein
MRKNDMHSSNTCDMYMCRLRHINDSVLSSLKMEGIRQFFYSRNNWARYDNKKHIGLHVKYRYSCQILVKLEFYRQIFEKYSNIKFHENPSRGSVVASRGRKDRHDEADSRFFFNFAKTPYLLTPWSRVLLKKLTVNFATSQEIPRIYGCVILPLETPPPPFPCRSEWGSSLLPDSPKKHI